VAAVARPHLCENGCRPMSKKPRGFITSVQTVRGCLHRKLKRAERLPRARRKHRNVTVLPRMAGAPAQQEINEPTSK
jgi:hypothetical protein